MLPLEAKSNAWIEVPTTPVSKPLLLERKSITWVNVFEENKENLEPIRRSLGLDPTEEESQLKKEDILRKEVMNHGKKGILGLS